MGRERGNRKGDVASWNFNLEELPRLLFWLLLSNAISPRGKDISNFVSQGLFTPESRINLNRLPSSFFSSPFYLFSIKLNLPRSPTIQ